MARASSKKKKADKTFGAVACTDHLGNAYPSIGEMCAAYGVNQSTFCGRRNRGLSLKQALMPTKGSKQRPSVVKLAPNQEHKAKNDKAAGTLTAGGVELDRYAPEEDARTDHRGIVYSSIADMCRAYSIPFGRYRWRIQQGWEKSEALTGHIQEPGRDIDKRTDHLGIVYETIEAMCRQYGISKKAYYSRRDKGWTKAEALLTPHRSYKRAHQEDRTDHLGNIYPSIVAMCRAYGVPSGVYRVRISIGWDKERALTVPVRQKNADEKDRTDHLGNVYPSIEAMCRHYKVPYRIYHTRMTLGWSKKEALTIPSKDGDISTTSEDAGGSSSERIARRTDHLGNVYPTQTAMCRYYGIRSAIYQQRIADGWEKEAALLTPSKSLNSRTDHLGTKYRSKAAMCAHWDTDPEVYDEAMRTGESKESALTDFQDMTFEEFSRLPIDHLGHRHLSDRDMCMAYGVPYHAYKECLANGGSLEEALMSSGYPDGAKGFHGYLVFPDGRVEDMMSRKPLAFDGTYRMSIDGVSAQVTKEELVRALFDNDEGREKDYKRICANDAPLPIEPAIPKEGLIKCIQFPDGRNADMVEMYGYHLFRDGTVISPSGRMVDNRRIVLRIKGQKFMMPVRYAIYASFSGDAGLEKWEDIGFKDGDRTNLVFANLEKIDTRTQG